MVEHFHITTCNAGHTRPHYVSSGNTPSKFLSKINPPFGHTVEMVCKQWLSKKPFSCQFQTVYTYPPLQNTFRHRQPD